MTTATNSSLGTIKLLGDLAGSTDGLAPELTATAVTPGAYDIPSLTIDAKGRVTAASNTSSMAIAAIIPEASASVKGIASFPAGSILVAAGVVSAVDASTSVKGVASFDDTYFNVSSGAVTFDLASIPIATGSVFGLAKSGTNITNTSGVLSIPDASTSVKGVASFNSTYFSTSSGAVSLDAAVALTSAQNTWTKAQSHSISTLTYGGTITPDFSLSNVFTLTATGNFTLANPTNVVAGTTYVIIVTQDATGGRLITWGSNFKFGAGAVQTLSTGANKRDIISVVALSPTVLLTTTQLGF